MIDIITTDQGFDMGVYDTEVERAKNILSVQSGALTYNDDFGIDLKYFLSQDFKFQNESFKSYLVQRLANYNVNVSSLAADVDALSMDLIFNISSRETSTELVAR